MWVPAGVPHILPFTFCLPGGVQFDPGSIWQSSILHEQRGWWRGGGEARMVGMDLSSASGTQSPCSFPEVGGEGKKRLSLAGRVGRRQGGTGSVGGDNQGSLLPTPQTQDPNSCPLLVTSPPSPVSLPYQHQGPAISWGPRGSPKDHHLYFPRYNTHMS